MSSLIQFLKPENQAQRARDQALSYINNFPPVIINGEDITREIREKLRARIEISHTLTLESIQARNAQFLGGLFAFFIEVHKAKTNFAAYVNEFQSETRKAQYAALQRIEQEIARSFPQEDAAKLLSSGRLSNDTKRVTNQIYKTSLEASEPASSQVAQSQYIPHHNIQQRIWGRDDIEAFEESQNQEIKANSRDRETTTQQAARAALPPGLHPPPRVARASPNHPEFEQVESVAKAVPTRGKHRRQETFVTFGSVNSGGSSGYEASSSGDSVGDSYQAANTLDDDDLEDIDVEAMYNNVSEVFDMYHQDGALENH